MSYDLYMFARAGRRAPSGKEFERYFEQRNKYTVKKDLAQYFDEHTGVSFVFGYAAKRIRIEPEIPIEYIGFDDVEEDDSEMPYPLMQFNINFSRPQQFAILAEPELTAFIKHFDLAIYDPQVNGMGQGEYSPQGFINGWIHCNELTRWGPIHAREVRIG